MSDEYSLYGDGGGNWWDGGGGFSLGGDEGGDWWDAGGETFDLGMDPYDWSQFGDIFDIGSGLEQVTDVGSISPEGFSLSSNGYDGVDPLLYKNAGMSLYGAENGGDPLTGNTGEFSLGGGGGELDKSLPELPMGGGGKAGGGGASSSGFLDMLKGGASAVKGATGLGPIQAGMGLASMGMMAKGMLTPTQQIKAKMPAEAQSAMARLNAQRSAMSGDAASRGYAGEEAIRAMTNQQIQDILSGKESGTSPQTNRMLTERRNELKANLLRDLGPGAFTASGEPNSTASINAMDSFERMAAELSNQEREGILGSRNSMAMQRGQMAQQNEMAPSQLDLNILQAFSPYANQQFQAGAMNAQAANQRNAQLGQMGGQGLGLVVGQQMANERAQQSNANLMAMLEAMRRR